MGVTLRKTDGLAFWTLSMWRTIEAMKKFVSTSPHQEAMQKLTHWCDEAFFGDWEQDTMEWPSWDHAAERLRASGRPAEVLHPSEQQKAGRIVTS